jgi:sarcosine oxidase subunit gamma
VPPRVVWAGPDDWFVIGPKGQADAIIERLRTALAGLHHAVTDVSSGYTVLHLGGAAVRDVLAQGCPLDLHPSVFKAGMAAGSHFFKASVWLWQTDDAATFEVLVRRSFMNYVWLMLERCTQECGLVTRRFV